MIFPSSSLEGNINDTFYLIYYINIILAFFLALIQLLTSFIYQDMIRCKAFVSLPKPLADCALPHGSHLDWFLINNQIYSARLEGMHFIAFHRFRERDTGK